jgi:hypothetical protein
MGKKSNAHSILVGMPARKTPFQKLGIHIRLTLKWIVKKYEDHPESKDHLAIKKYKQNEVSLLQTLRYLFFYTFATTIQAFVITCDKFLYAFVIDLYHQSI